jgi:hypothetical protein
MNLIKVKMLSIKLRQKQALANLRAHKTPGCNLTPNLAFTVDH